MNKVTNTLILFFLLFTLGVFAQKVERSNLHKLLKHEKLNIVNREAKAIDSTQFNYIKLSEKKGEGIVWLPIKDFKNGTIKIEMRGKNVYRKSFIGIAFHGENDTTYDAVYCRPANFFAKDSIIRTYAIQYVSHPFYTWKKIRELKEKSYEKEITNPPNPNGWFKMTLVIDNKIIKAFINDAKEPSLEFQKFSNNQNGKVGIFVGDDSGGDFSNVVVKHSKY